MEERQRHAWRARLVTYGLLGTLVFGVVQHVEAWPVTSYRLFSQVRTDRSSGLELVAVGPDGDRRMVRLGHEVVATTAHQYRRLGSMSPADQRTKVRAWLELADLDESEVASVRLERVARRLDPDGGPAIETSRTLVVEVEL